MKISVKLVSVVILITLGVIACILALSELSMAQTKEIDSLKKSSTQKANSNHDTNKTYQVGDRLKPNNQAKSATLDTTSKTTRFKTISWEELIPADWDPSADFKNMDLGNFNDADPRAISALQKLRKAWDNAPTNPLLNQQQIRIPGFVVPLDIENGKVGAFLLVPYFGGCLHTPPPPANQIIEVQLAQAQPIKTMDAVWVSGQLESVRSQTELGTAGYRLNAVKVTPYKETNRR
ncbi:DUF3299 domain-containing protein [Undibacterium baiyunense]|uniref:DUF3299 domain-containing protein n=1 Tax=Undibacterium baiyunense TaxID=2828731 RepID=A0A941DFZ4_9BURK|nr:DUF3299 domain-containing protein [Undibacterium baiyunense]MBR7746835.1 DUF3299 domain-containing protein [Undibacterium baiyunense]